MQSVHIVPEMALVMIKFDLSRMRIQPQHSKFIDLETSKPLNLEMKLNTNRFLNMTAEEMANLTFRDLYSNQGF